MAATSVWNSEHCMDVVGLVLGTLVLPSAEQVIARDGSGYRGGDGKSLDFSFLFGDFSFFIFHFSFYFFFFYFSLPVSLDRKDE